MTRALLFRSRPRPAHRAAPAPFTLADLIAALAMGCPGGYGLEALLDRVEGRA